MWLDVCAFNITVTSWWTRWRIKSPASPLLTQPFVQAQIKENIKTPCHLPLCREFTVTGGFPAQMASNGENFSIWWRHHDDKKLFKIGDNSAWKVYSAFSDCEIGSTNNELKKGCLNFPIVIRNSWNIDKQDTMHICEVPDILNLVWHLISCQLIINAIILTLCSLSHMFMLHPYAVIHHSKFHLKSIGVVGVPCT